MSLSLGSHTLPFGIHKFCFNVTYLNTVGQASENLGKLSMFQWLCSVPVFMPGHTEQLGMGCLDNEGLSFSSQDSGSLSYLIISVNCIFKKCHQDISKKNV